MMTWYDQYYINDVITCLYLYDDLSWSWFQNYYYATNHTDLFAFCDLLLLFFMLIDNCIDLSRLYYTVVYSTYATL